MIPSSFEGRVRGLQYDHGSVAAETDYLLLEFRQGASSTFWILTTLTEAV